MIEATHKRSDHRIKIIQGQLNGLQKMIDNDVYCMDILTQSLAIQKSLASLSKLMVSNHISEHVIPLLSSNDPSKHGAAHDDLLAIFELHNVRGEIPHSEI